MSRATLNERISSAAEAEIALRHLGPASDAVIAAYMRRMTDVAAKEPWEARKITNLAMAARIAEEVRNWVEAIVRDGAVAQQEVERVRRIEKLPEARKKILGIG